MASYIESSLGRNERIVYKAQVSWLSQFGRLVFGALLALLIREIPIIGIIGILFIIVAVLNVMTTELALTNKRLIAKAGFIRRQTIELNIDRAESLSVIQGFWGRIFNYGSIVVRGTGGSHAPIPYIARPMDFRQQFNDFIDNEIGGGSKIKLN
ncbi:TPA: PH domain-containing protein [Neisseria subflava]